MNEYLADMPSWAALVPFTIISIFRIARWVIPNKHRGVFIKYAPYSRKQLYLLLVSIMAFLGYIAVIVLNSSIPVKEKVICGIMVSTLVITLLLPDKEYELGTLTAFGFRRRD